MNRRSLLALALSLAIPFFSATISAGEDPVVPPPKEQNPTVAERGYFEKFPRAWNDFHKLYLERAKQGSVDVLFLGDSILQGWTDAAQKDLWKTHFDAYKSANFSIGGDRTQQVLWRITNGELDGLAPKVVVLHIGCNNLWVNDTPQNISDGIAKIVETLRKKLPAAKVLVLGILPVQKSGADAAREKLKQVNTAIAKLADGTAVRFLDIGSKFVDSAGNIDADKDLYQLDFVHLKPKGYETWAAAVQPVIAEMLK